MRGEFYELQQALDPRRIQTKLMQSTNNKVTPLTVLLVLWMKFVSTAMPSVSRLFVGSSSRSTSGSTTRAEASRSLKVNIEIY
jgi:hypothetical protein